MVAINSYPTEDLMIIPQTQSYFTKLYGDKNGPLALIKETTYFKELLAGENGDNIKKCSPLSVQSALFTILGNGLSLSPILQEATIIPRKKKNSEVMIATVSVMYSGKIKMMAEAQVISHIKYSEVVYNCDMFTCTNGVYIHSKNFNKPADAVKMGVFLIAVLPNGTERHVWLDKDELAKRRKASKTPYLWDAWEDQYWKKTAIHELFKYLPKTKATADLVQKFEQEEMQDVENTYNESSDGNTESEVITPTVVVEPEPEPEIQDPMLVDALSQLIAEHGAELLTPEQIDKTKEGLPTYSNEKLTILITSMKKRIEDAKPKNENSPPF